MWTPAINALASPAWWLRKLQFAGLRWAFSHQYAREGECPPKSRAWELHKGTRGTPQNRAETGASPLQK